MIPEPGAVRYCEFCGTRLWYDEREEEMFCPYCEALA